MMNLFDAYILGYGFCYLVAGICKDFYVIRPNIPNLLSKLMLFLVGLIHILAVLYFSPFIIVPLAFIESYSCVLHWSGKVTWNGSLSNFSNVHGAYAVMAVFDLADITFLLSKLIV